MTDALEHIYADADAGTICGSYDCQPYDGATAFIRLDLHEAAVAAARAEGWNAAIKAAADEAEEHKNFVKGIECCAECIRKMARDAA